MNHLSKYFLYPKRDRIRIGLILLTISLLYLGLILPLLWRYIEVYLFPIFFALPAMFFLLKKNFTILIMESDRLYYNHSVLGYGREAFIFIIFPYLYLNKNQLIKLMYDDILEYQFIKEDKESIRILLVGILLTNINKKVIKEIKIKLKNGKQIYWNAQILSDKEFLELNTIFDVKFKKK